MGSYTTFYFRAKLNFTTAESVRRVLRFQFNENGDGQWPGTDLHEHAFFALPRKQMIPWSNNFDDTLPRPRFQEYPDGSLIIEFTCEFKNYDDEIEQFLDWIRPHIRLRYAKRNRGRQKVWVGYMKPEGRPRINLFVKAAPRPGCFEGNLFDRVIELA